MADTSARLVPNCKVSVDGSPLDPPVQASLVRLQVDLDADLFAQTTLLFADPNMKLMGGDTFACGAAISVRIGYGSNLETIFDGEVVRLEPQFRKDQPISLAVVCQESMHRLALSQSTRALNDVDVSDVVTQIAQDHGFSSDAPSGTKQHILQGNVSNATMLRRLGHRLGLRVRVEGKKLIMGPPPSTDAVPLLMKDGIQKVKVKVKSGGQVSEISVHGWDPKNKQEVVGKAQPQGEVGKGGTDYGDSAALADSSGDNMPPDQATAEAMAKGRMTRLNEGYIKSQIDMIGDARMTPGQKVDLDKMGPGIDGTWRIERAHHDFSRRGYFVKMEAVRISAKKPAPPAAPKAKNDPPKQDKDNRLVRPRWKRRVDGQNDVADMAVDATKELEGKTVKFILETRVDGSWKQVATANGTVSSGTATATANLDKLDTSAFTKPKWTAAKDLQHNTKDSGEVSISATAKDGIEVRVILEQQNGRGWDKIQQKSSNVSGGEVKATFTLAHPNDAESGKDDSKLLKIPQWNTHPVTHGSTGALQIRAPGLADGRSVQFDVEQMGADGIWKLVRTVQGAIDRGTAGVSLPDLRHPALNAQPAHADVLSKPTWDAKTLLHGGTGKFTVQAEGLDGRVVAFIVERNDAGTWTQLVRATGKVSGGKAEASASFAHPTTLTKVATKPAPRPKLGNPRWDAQTVAHDDSVTATIEATNLEGATIQFVAERSEAGGWVEAGRGTGVVKDGKASASIDVSHPTADTDAPDAADDGIAPKLANPRWDASSFSHGDAGTAIIDVEGLEGATLQFIAERLETGGWVEAGRGTGTVSKGQATGAISIQHPGSDDDLRKLRFSTSVLTNPKEALSSPLPVKYDPKTGKATANTGGHFEGRQVRFVYETKSALGWQVTKSVIANVSKALASAQLPTTAPKGTLTSPKWASNVLVHGDEAECTVTAANLNGKKVKFTVERQQDDGSWAGVGSATATVANNKATATIPVSHPAAGQSDAAAMAHLRFNVVPVNQTENRVRAQMLPDLAPRSLRFRAAVIDNPNDADSQIETAFDPKTGIASAQVGGTGNPSVRFTLQQKGTAGWVNVATATGRASGGKAQVTLPVHHTANAKLVNPRWAQTALLHGDEAKMVVDGKGLDGQRVKFIVEELVDGAWSEAGNSLALIVRGQANGSVTVLHKPGDAVALKSLRFRAVLDLPELRVQAEMAADLDPKRLRFRAELVPDHTKQKLRFKAQPIPDLAPKKIRFRGELPVPQDPALTRLRCSVPGADEVQTGNTKGAGSGQGSGPGGGAGGSSASPGGNTGGDGSPGSTGGPSGPGGNSGGGGPSGSPASGSPASGSPGSPGGPSTSGPSNPGGNNNTSSPGTPSTDNNGGPDTTTTAPAGTDGSGPGPGPAAAKDYTIKLAANPVSGMVGDTVQLLASTDLPEGTSVQLTVGGNAAAQGTVSGGRVTANFPIQGIAMPGSASLSAMSNITVTVDAPGAATTVVTGQLAVTDHKWIRSLYANLLNRPPEAGAVQYYFADTQRGMSNVAIANCFFNSPELCNNRVTDLYRTLLGREPDAGGLQNWSALLQGGTAMQQIITGFLDSVEYHGKFAGNDAWVESLYQNVLGRASDAGGKAGWVGSLNRGGTPASVISGFLKSQEYATLRVTSFYQNYLGRAPEAAGLAGWVGQVMNGLAMQQIECDFVTSPEYWGRVNAQTWWLDAPFGR